MKPNRILTASVAALLLIVSLLLTSCSELKTTLPPATSNSLQVHDNNWDNNPASPSFHGAYLKSVGWGAGECKSCHGTTFTGGTSGKSCFTCHPSYPHSAGFSRGSSHGAYLANLGYPMASCQTCHGATYSGGAIAAVTCMKSGCHADANNTPRSPESCNTCHGDFAASGSNILAGAPPKGVNGETISSARGVGAHQKHLATNSLGTAVRCQECHTVPTQLSSTGHLGTLPAEVAFNDKLAPMATGGVVPNPLYDPTTLKCSNTFCHGNWKMRKATTATSNQFAYIDSVMSGLNHSPVWTNGSTEVTCGSCHGLPPKGHVDVALTTCGSCHFGIVSTDGKITDKAKHINGKINVFDREYSF